MTRKLINADVKLGKGTLLDEAVNDLFEVYVPTLLNGWQHQGERWGDLTVYKLGNIVFFQGLISGGNISENMFVLPEKFRPSREIYALATDSDNNTSRITIRQNGETYGRNIKNNWVVLTGVSFIVE